MYKIYLQFRNGADGYLSSEKVRSVYYNSDYEKEFPTFKAALSKANLIKRNYSIVGYVGVAKA